MSALQAKKRKPFILTRPIEAILRAIRFHHFMTALDVAHLLYSLSSLTYVRGILSSLAGGADFKNAQFLYRFQLPAAKTGGSEKIYTLGSKGRDFLAKEAGVPVDWYFRPQKVRHLSYSQVVHNLLLTRFLVSAHTWAAKQPDFRLVKTRICYDLAREAATVEVGKETLPAGKQRKTEKLKVIPDAWMLFEKLSGGAHKHFLPIWLEVDRGTEHSSKFKHHLRSRIEFIRSGAYSKLFEAPGVTIAYVTTGDLPEYRETRRRAMCAWTQEVLADLHMENWSSIFRFASVVFEELYTIPLFDDEPVWYRPDLSTPVTLFTP
jgi:hypothetical protein